MSILSFDIGIKNLAYCLLCKDTQEIKDWGIINISCDDNCQYINTKGIACDKSAKHQTTWFENEIHLCPSHTKLKKYTPPLKKKFKKIKTNNSIYNIGRKMIEKLDELFSDIELNEIIVENQPSLKNPTMKSIQMMVYTYFLINNENANLEMINARNKLKVYNGPKIDCEIKDKYKKNKYLAIKYCHHMIKENEDKFIQLYNESKKKDDLADCYLQGIYYINK